MPIFEVQGPDGALYEVDAPDMETAAGAFAPQAQAEPAMPQEPNTQAKGDQAYGAMDSGILGAADTAGFGFGDEIAGAIGGVVEGLGRPEGFMGAYERVRDNSRRMLSQAQTDNPKSFLGGQVAGGVLTGFAPGAAAMRAPTLAAKAIRGAGIGAAEGAAYGAGSADGDMTDRAQGAAIGGGVGAGLGAAAPWLGNKIGKVFSNPARGAPAAEAVEQAKNAMYGRLDQAGIKYDANAYQSFARRLVDDVKAKGFNPRNSPTIANDLEEILGQVGKSPDYAELESLRKAIGNLPTTASRHDRMLAGVIKEKLDHFTEWAPFIHNGSTPDAPALMKQAREMASRNIKSRTIEEAITAAREASSGFENGLAVEFRKILRNPNKRRGFTEAEKEAMRKVTTRAGGQNILRALSQFGIDFGNLGGSSNLMATLAGGGGIIAGEPMTGAALVAAGTAAKPIAAANANRMARNVQKVIRAGKNAQNQAMQRRVPFQQGATGLLSNQTGAVDSLAPWQKRYGLPVR